MASFGTCLAGPTLHFWYAKVLANLFPNPGLQSTAAKLVLDQTAFTASFISVFFYYMTRMDGQSHEAAVSKIRRDLWSTVQANWMLWVPVQLANFSFVPVLYQVLVVNCTGLLWNCYLSYAQYGKKPRH
jgi:protein Mpv17